MIRTELAAERTLLAYGRTAIMVIATAVTLIKFFPDTRGMMELSLIIAAVGLTLLLLGIHRHRRLGRRLTP